MLANIIRNSKKSVGGGGGGIVIDGGDPYYSAVSLMLSMDGTNGSTTFTDSSLNALTVTASGNAQISTTQSKYGASGYFDGAGDYINAPSGSQFQFGTGDFTVEMWVWASSNPGNYKCLFSNRGVDASSIFLGIDPSAKLLYYRGAFLITDSVALSLNQWYHVALVRKGSVITLYKNGVSAGSVTDTTNLTGNTCFIAQESSLGSTYFNGYIDDFRISRFARYVSNFTPPTAALPTTASSTVADPYYNYTSLLLHMDGANASTNFVDSGPSALTVTAAANAQISTTQSKFGAASGYFDGTGDSLTIPANSVFALGTGNYTIEGWFYSLTSGTSLRGMIDFRTAATGTNGLMLRENDGGFLVYLNNATILSTTTGRIANQWQHVALVRNGTTVTLYVDGVSQTSVTSSTNLTDNAMRISGFVDTQSSVYTYNGYIDDLRITKYARYTSAFTPPAAALPEYATGNDRYFSNVSLLLHMDGANGSTTFTDNSSNALTVTAVGNAQISTTQSKYGGAGGYFDGTGDYLAVTGNASAFAFPSDFTVEGFVYFLALPTNGNYAGLFFARGASAAASAFQFYIFNSVGTYRFETTISVGATDYQGTYNLPSTPTTGVWYHFAFVRSGSSVSAYWNGVQAGSATTASGTTNTPSTQIAIGGRGTPYTGLYLNGYIDEFRVSKFARYTAAFTPPTTVFPNA